MFPRARRRHCPAASDEIDLGALPHLALVEQVRIGSLDDPDAGFTRPIRRSRRERDAGNRPAVGM